MIASHHPHQEISEKLARAVILIPPCGRRIPVFVESSKYRDPSSSTAPQDDILGGFFLNLLVAQTCSRILRLLIPELLNINVLEADLDSASGVKL